MKKYISKSNLLFVGISLASFVIGILWGQGGVQKVEAINPAEADAFSIFRNNFLIGLSMAFMGGTTGGVYSCVVLLVNGYLLGELLQYLFAEKMYSYIVEGLLPHMGLEMLGLICFAVVGFMPIRELISWIKHERMTMPLRNILKTVCVWMLFGTASLIAAALIEGNISIVK